MISSFSRGKANERQSALIHPVEYGLEAFQAKCTISYVTLPVHLGVYYPCFYRDWLTGSKGAVSEVRLHWDIRKGQGQSSLGSQRPALSQTFKDNGSNDNIWPTKTHWKDFWQTDIWPSLKPNDYLSVDFFHPRLKTLQRLGILQGHYLQDCI